MHPFLHSLRLYHHYYSLCRRLRSLLCRYCSIRYFYHFLLCYRQALCRCQHSLFLSRFRYLLFLLRLSSFLHFLFGHYCHSLFRHLRSRSLCLHSILPNLLYYLLCHLRSRLDLYSRFGSIFQYSLRCRSYPGCRHYSLYTATRHFLYGFLRLLLNRLHHYSLLEGYFHWLSRQICSTHCRYSLLLHLFRSLRCRRYLTRRRRYFLLASHHYYSTCRL